MTYYFEAISDKTKEVIIIQAKDATEARHKVINSLDLSLDWAIRQAEEA